MATQKPALLPASLAAFQGSMNPANMKLAGQPVQRLSVPANQLAVFAAHAEASFPGLTVNAKLTRDLAPNGVTPLTSYAVYFQVPGNNIQIYYTGRGSAAGACAAIEWPLDEKTYNKYAKALNQPLMGEKAPVVAVSLSSIPPKESAKAKAAKKTAAKRVRSAKPAEVTDADRNTA